MPAERARAKSMMPPPMPGYTIEPISTGIMLLTESMRPLYMNPIAATLIRRMSTDGEEMRRQAVPHPIQRLCVAVRQQGSGQAVTAIGERELLLIAFQLPDDGGRSRMLILMSDAGRPRCAIHQAAERYGLTEREQSVVRHLALGYTNKEIGTALCIAEQTVKEHMKHVMIKTGSGTRTGLIARILAAADESEPADFSETMAG